MRLFASGYVSQKTYKTTGVFPVGNNTRFVRKSGSICCRFLFLFLDGDFVWLKPLLFIKVCQDQLTQEMLYFLYQTGCL